MKLKTLAAALGLGLSLASGSAMADPSITGLASLTGGFSTYSASAGAVVSDLTFIDVTGPALVLGTSGDFTPDGLATATDFSIAPFVSGLIYSFNGFTFTVTSVSSIVGTPLSCGVTGCTDDLSFDIAGTVTAAGYAPTAFSGTWTGNGSCAEGAPLGPPFTCAGGKSGSWSVSLVSIGQNVPEPGTLALLGLGLAGLGLARRRKI